MRKYEFYNFTTGGVTRRSFSRLKYALAYGQHIEANTMIRLLETGYTGAHWWNVQTGERRRRTVHPHRWAGRKNASPFLCTANLPS